MKVNNSIITHGASHSTTPSLEQVRRYIACSVEERQLVDRGALGHTPFQIPHHEDTEKVAHTFDGRSGGLGLLMEILDKQLGLNSHSIGTEASSELRRRKFERMA